MSRYSNYGYSNYRTCFCVPTVHPIAPAGPTIEAFIIARITLFLDTLYLVKKYTNTHVLAYGMVWYGMVWYGKG